MKRAFGLILVVMCGVLAVGAASAATYRYDYRGNPLTMVSPVTGKTYTTRGFRFSIRVDEALLGDTVTNGFSFHVGIGQIADPWVYDYSWAADTMTGSETRTQTGGPIDSNGGLTFTGGHLFEGSQLGAMDFAVAADGSITWSFYGYSFDYASVFSSAAGDVWNSGQTVLEIFPTGQGPLDYDFVYTPLNYTAPAADWTVIAAVPVPASLPLLALALGGLVLASAGRRRKPLPLACRA
jgi:hypothetical protein